MDLHIVGGFLGSGKTTAIIGAAKHLMAQGKRVGVVTNDQGRYLVDTAFFTSEAVPAVEVTGGCFCCNYADLDAQLAQLKESAQPDVIFAESVGSCADIVATVVKPLLQLRESAAGTPTSFSVFADARLLRRRLLDQPMPFGDNVTYLFDKQIEEAGILVINKRDLLSEEAVDGVAVLARERFPHALVRTQNSLVEEEVVGWIAAIAPGRALSPGRSLDIDYERYGAGEAALAWLDERLVFEMSEGRGREVVIGFMSELLHTLEHRHLAIGHLKFMVTSGGVEVKASFPTLGTDDWKAGIPELPGGHVELIVNARVEAPAPALRQLVQQAAESTASALGVTCEVHDVASFHPGFPSPTHRIG